MPENLLKPLITLIQAVELKLAVPALAALAGVWLQARLSRKQAFRNKIWELRQESYGQFLAKVFDLWQEAEEWIAAEDETGAAPKIEAIDRELSSLRPMSTAGSLMWGRNFIAAARQWKADWDKRSDPSLPVREQLRAFCTATADHFDEMHLAARRDLQA